MKSLLSVVFILIFLSSQHIKALSSFSTRPSTNSFSRILITTSSSLSATNSLFASATNNNKNCDDVSKGYQSTTSLCSTTDSNNMSSTSANQQPRWYQKQISITAPSRGCHLITSDINKAINTELSSIKIGMANLFIQHTSASLTINENADPDVRRDMEVALNKIVPASWNHDGTFRHTMEGDDDMPGHVKTSLIGPSLNIPIRNGRLALGTWQGVYLNEHRDQGGWGGGHTRNIIITLQGQGH